MDIQAFRKKLDDLGYPNEVSTPDPSQEFTTAAFGTTLCCDDGPELEIKLPANRVRAIAVEDVERWNDLMAQAYLNNLGKR
jgi:hypothetical protein